MAAWELSPAFLSFREHEVPTRRPLLTVTIAGELKAKSKTNSQRCSAKAEAPLTVTAPTILVQAHSTCLAAGRGFCCLLRPLAARLADIQCHSYQQLCGDQVPSGGQVPWGWWALQNKTLLSGRSIQQPLAEPPWLNRVTTLGLFYTKINTIFLLRGVWRPDSFPGISSFDHSIPSHIASAGLEKQLTHVPAHWGHLPISQAPQYVEMLMYLERSH